MRPVRDAKVRNAVLVHILYVCTASGWQVNEWPTDRLGKALSDGRFDHVCSEHRHSAPQPTSPYFVALVLSLCISFSSPPRLLSGCIQIPIPILTLILILILILPGAHHPR